MHHVMIHPASYDTCRKSVDKAFELFPQTIAQKKVLIKPNVLRTSRTDEHIVTHPALLRAVVEKIEELSPAQIIVGDNPGLFNYGDNEAAFRQTGLMEAAKGYYKNLGNEMTAVKFHKDFMAQVGVSTDILEADIVISLPKFKTHGLTIITGAIKNSYGILPGAQKARLHQIAGSPERFHELVVHVFCLRIPDLFIMDAVIGMEGNGPASPDLRDIGLILAADNAVAMDSVMARMMGLDPKNLRFLQKANELGLGHFDEKRIQTTDKIKVIPNFKLPPLSGKSIMDNQQIQDFMNQRASVIPRPDPQLCTACGDCIEHCPVGALEMGIEVPQADMSKCITCFCCQEICPEKAMILI